MSRPFSWLQFVLGICLIVLNVGINSWILTNHQPFAIGTFVIGTDWGQSIILCNAGMICFILLVDLINAFGRWWFGNYRVGKGINYMYGHEHHSHEA